jgi:RecB family exonuclease
VPSEPSIALIFGKMIHAVLERLLREVVEEEHVGALSEERALKFYRQAWAASRLSGMDVFAEGFSIIREFVREQGVVNHRDVLAIEHEFHLPVGCFEVLGYMDRVDCIDNETIEIIDYKSNYLLFTREELDSSLQMSLYELAARKLSHTGATRSRACVRPIAGRANRVRQRLSRTAQPQLLLLRPSQELRGLLRSVDGNSALCL